MNQNMSYHCMPYSRISQAKNMYNCSKYSTHAILTNCHCTLNEFSNAQNLITWWLLVSG